MKGLSLSSAVAPSNDLEIGKNPEYETAVADKTELFNCDVCDAKYQKFGMKIRHMKNKHGVVIEPLFSCNKCEKTFGDVKKLNRQLEELSVVF